jgi:hypothetical protein
MGECCRVFELLGFEFLDLNLRQTAISRRAVLSSCQLSMLGVDLRRIGDSHLTLRRSASR